MQLLDTSPTAVRRSSEITRPRGDCRKPAIQLTAERPRPNTAARRTRIDDAIVSQWVLDQTRQLSA